MKTRKRSGTLQNRRRVAVSPIDLQSRRTRKAIWDALVLLLQECDLDRITVSRICEIALVHRVTFYKHFENKYDLLERGSYEMFRIIASRIEEPDKTFGQIQRGKTPSNITKLFRYVEEHEHVFRRLLSDRAGQSFRNMLIDFLATLAEQRLLQLRNSASEHAAEIAPIQTDDSSTSLEGRISAGAIAVCLDWWLARSPRPAAEEMARSVGRFLAHGAMGRVGLGALHD